MSVHLGMALGKSTLLLNKSQLIRNNPHNVLKRLADAFSGVQKANWESSKAEPVFLLQVTAQSMSFIVLMFICVCVCVFYSRNLFSMTTKS